MADCLESETHFSGELTHLLRTTLARLRWEQKSESGTLRHADRIKRCPLLSVSRPAVEKRTGAALGG
jgi:hypothetical protein